MGSNAYVFGGFHFFCELCRPGGLGVSRESYDIKPRSTRRYGQYQTDLLPMDRLWQRTTKPAPMPAAKPTNRTESPEPIDSSPISRDRLEINSTSSKAHLASTPHHPQSQQHPPVFPVPAIPKTEDDDNDDPIQQQQPFNLPPPLHPRYRAAEIRTPRRRTTSFRPIVPTRCNLASGIVPQCLARIDVCISTMPAYRVHGAGISRTYRRLLQGEGQFHPQWGV